MSSKQYREFARECMLWAEESTSEQDRQHFLEMAKAWNHAAVELGEPSHSHLPEPPLRPRSKRKMNG
jgi:NAD-dependent oxidoreductase involved in siderophore biosynthesis